MLDANAFYTEYHGHRLQHLEMVNESLQHQHKIYLCGDSSLDNKFWLGERVKAVNGMEHVLLPSVSRPDIAHNLNDLASTMGVDLACLNSAVEESTLSDRGSGLLPQDAFAQSAVRPGKDFIVCCAGGNDVVLKPTLSTITALIALLSCSSDDSLANGSAWGLSHFVSMFCKTYGEYVHRLCRNKPKCAIVCMVYFPQHSLPGVSSWADTSLGLMGYNRNPEKLQRVMRAVFELGVKRITPPEGTTLIPLALFDVLDPESSHDYVQRVEPSAVGGRKMAKAIFDALTPYLPPIQSFE